MFRQQAFTNCTGSHPHHTPHWSAIIRPNRLHLWAYKDGRNCSHHTRLCCTSSAKNQCPVTGRKPGMLDSSRYALQVRLQQGAGQMSHRLACLFLGALSKALSKRSRRRTRASRSEIRRAEVFKCSVIHFAREDDESMKPPSDVKTPAQYIASLPADRAKTIATMRALVNKHIPRGYDECLV